MTAAGRPHRRRSTLRELAVTVAFLALPGAGCAPDAAPAVVGVRAQGCGAVPAVGSGAFVGAGTILTAAHTVAGATTVDVAVGPRWLPAEIVALDPRHDLAMLHVAHRSVPPLPTASRRPGRATAATAYAWRAGHVQRVDVTIVRPVMIRTTDMYREGAVARPGYELAGTILPGDSGAAVLVDGWLVGVVWARSSAAPGRAYAIDAAALTHDPGADPTRCAPAPHHTGPAGDDQPASAQPRPFRRLIP